MNERLKKLMIESGAFDYYEINEGVAGDEQPMIKLAEMIVQELISKVVNRHPEYFASQALKWQMGCRIKEYFGVDEE